MKHVVYFKFEKTQNIYLFIENVFTDHVGNGANGHTYFEKSDGGEKIYFYKYTDSAY